MAITTRVEVAKKSASTKREKIVPTSGAGAAASSAPKSSVSSPALRVERPLPAKSVQKAARAFKNFSLSRFTGTRTPANFVPAGHPKTPSTVAALHRKSMMAQTEARASNPSQNLGITVALTEASLGRLLPSLDTKTGTVKLDELLGALKQNLRGTEFYASGNPTLNLVMQDSELLSQVQAYINAVKAGTAGDVTAPAAARPAIQLGPSTKPRAAARPRVAANAAAANRERSAVAKRGA